jgi:hypothetical protein
MKWNFEKFEINKSEIWDQFIDNDALNATFIHTRRFLHHQPQNIYQDASLLFYKKKKLAACIPALCIKNGEETIWNSHMRATYGGLILSKNVGNEDVLEIFELLENYWKENKINKIIIRNTFRIFQTQWCDEVDYALWKNGFQILSREVEIGIDLKNKSIAQIEKNYDNGNKYNIKKAYKEIEVSINSDYITFWKMLEVNLKERHQVKPVHDIDTFQYLLSCCKPEEIKLFSAFKNKQMIAGMVVFLFKNKFMHAQYIASNSNFQNLRPINAVIDFAIKFGIQNQFEYFNLGTPNEQAGKVINLGLTYFKESFGARSCLRETMTKTIIE